MKITVKKLKKVYEARLNDKDIITIDGCEFVPDYLKYVIEYATRRRASWLTFVPTAALTQ